MTHILHNCCVIDGISNQPQPGLDVIVSGTTITRIEPTRPRHPHEGTIIDGSAYTLLPGLIDCHAHYTLDPWAVNPFTQIASEPVGMTMLRAARTARDGLYAGVTTVRDAGAPRWTHPWPAYPRPRLCDYDYGWAWHHLWRGS
jgi:imidazolonepropionase-like amidohydrolase